MGTLALKLEELLFSFSELLIQSSMSIGQSPRNNSTGRNGGSLRRNVGSLRQKDNLASNRTGLNESNDSQRLAPSAHLSLAWRGGVRFVYILDVNRRASGRLKGTRMCLANWRVQHYRTADEGSCRTVREKLLQKFVCKFYNVKSNELNRLKFDPCIGLVSLN